MTAWCAQCLDEFSPIEGNDPPQDPDEPVFCSDQCRERWTAQMAADTAYYEARQSGAPAL